MESDQNISIITHKVHIERGDPDIGDDSVVMVFKDLNVRVMLSDSTIDDVKQLFDNAFDFIVDEKNLIEFEIEDTENDLFNHVTRDIIDQLNAEIKESADNFMKIWDLVN